MAAAKAPALRREPAVEAGIAVDLQAGKKLAGKQAAQPLQVCQRQGLNACLGRPADLGGIDETVRQIEPEAVAAAFEARLTSFIDDAAQLAEAPPQFPARIVPPIPNQFPQL